MKIAKCYKQALGEINKYLSENPREAEHTRRVYNWLRRLEPHPSEELRLAVFIHDLKKWDIKREKFPAGKDGHMEWRERMKNYSAYFGDAILTDIGYYPKTRKRVIEILLYNGSNGNGNGQRPKRNRPDSEIQAFRDADRLDFLSEKLPNYYAFQWDSRVIREEMRDAYNELSPEAREIARKIEYKDERLSAVFKEVLSEIEDAN